jgi:hypothetical protein
MRGPRPPLRVLAMACLLLASGLGLGTSPQACEGQSSWASTYDVTWRMMGGAVTWVQEVLGVGDLCPFVDNFADAARTAVNAKIACQDRWAWAGLSGCDAGSEGVDLAGRWGRSSRG